MDDGRPVKRAFPAEHWTDVVARCREDVAQARQEAVEAMEAAAAATKEAAAAKRDAVEKLNKAAQTVENLSQQNRSLVSRVRELEGRKSSTQTEMLSDISEKTALSFIMDDEGVYLETSPDDRTFAPMQLEAIRWASALIGLEKMVDEVLLKFAKVKAINKDGSSVSMLSGNGHVAERAELARSLEKLRIIMTSSSGNMNAPSNGHNEFLLGSVSQIPLNTPDRLEVFLNRKHFEDIKAGHLI